MYHIQYHIEMYNIQYPCYNYLYLCRYEQCICDL